MACGITWYAAALRGTRCRVHAGMSWRGMERSLCTLRLVGSGQAGRGGRAGGLGWAGSWMGLGARVSRHHFSVHLLVTFRFGLSVCVSVLFRGLFCSFSALSVSVCIFARVFVPDVLLLVFRIILKDGSDVTRC